jgi:hypothetical protein
MHKMEFGQLYCMDLLKMILNKFILYFSEFNSISYKFWNLKGIFGILKNLKNWKMVNSVGPRFRPQGLRARPGPAANDGPRHRCGSARGARSPSARALGGVVACKAQARRQTGCSGAVGSRTRWWWRARLTRRVSHPVFRPKLNAFLYVCQDQVSHIKR